MMKKLCLVSICLLSSLVYTQQELNDNMSLAINDLAVVRVKSLVSSLNNLDISQEEKKKAVQKFVLQATRRAHKLDSKVSIGRSLKDIIKLVFGGCGLLYNCSGILDFRDHLLEPEWYVDNAIWFLMFGYVFNKGRECYSQREDLDKALRIKKWLEEQQDKLAAS